MAYDWNFDVVWTYRHALARGTWVTLQLSGIAIFAGTLLGIVFAMSRMSSVRSVSLSTATLIELFRALPLLVLMVWMYYCLPILVPMRLNAFTTAAIALSLHHAAFAAEVFRAGIEAIPRGYAEAARAVGMTESQAFFRITLPQATRSMIPALVGLFISVLKLSSLASAISVFEILHSANDIITRTFRPLEIFTAIAVIYLVLILPLSLLSQRYESKAFLLKSNIRED